MDAPTIPPQTTDPTTIDTAALIEAYDEQAAQRKARMGRDYWDRRLDRAPLVAAVPHNGRTA